MITNSYTLTGRNIEGRVSEFVRNFFQSAYESSYSGGFLRVFEDYSFWNKNNPMVCIRIDTTEAENGKIRIEVITGGNSDKVLVSSIFGSERRRINGFAKQLQNFCNEQMITYSAD